MTDFEALGLSSVVLKAIKTLGYQEPTPIQEQAIPLVLEGHDVMGLAQTGTGKTAAFGLPLAHRLLEARERPIPRTVHALILAPTRELVTQIAENVRDFVRGSGLRVQMIVGGQPITRQMRAVERGTDVLVATPGRLLDLVKRRALFLDNVRYLVLDEADQMLDLGFIHSLRTISALVGKPRQTLMFSATMPRQINELSQAFQEDPVRIEMAVPGRAADKIRQSVHFVGARGKLDLLKGCLIENSVDRSLVFARTKHGAERLMLNLVEAGIAAGSLHGNKSQSQRDRVIRAFRSGEIRVLVATDVAARGIDIPGVGFVYNFDLPEVAENYVHRIGRTARAGAEGEAVAFCTPDDVSLLMAIERLMGMTVPVASGERFAPNGQGAPRRRGGKNSGRGPGARKTGGGNRDVAASSGAKHRSGPRPARAGQDPSSDHQRTRRDGAAAGETRQSAKPGRPDGGHAPAGRTKPGPRSQRRRSPAKKSRTV